MRVLELDINDTTEQIVGQDKSACLAELRNHLETKEFNSVVIHTGYKEKRGLFTRVHALIDLDYMPEDSGTDFVIDISENGGGEFEDYASRQEAIDRFLCIVEEKGEHWD